MYTVSSVLYNTLAEHLCEAINGRGFYSGTIDLTHDLIECRFTCSVIVYRKPMCDMDGLIDSPIVNLVPVWWEFHTTAPEGELINDFDFGELRDCIL